MSGNEAKDGLKSDAINVLEVQHNGWKPTKLGLSLHIAFVVARWLPLSL